MISDSPAITPHSFRAGLSRLSRLRRDPGIRVVFESAGSLIGTMAVTSLLGFVYWWVAARLFQPSAVGFAAASISAMNLLGSVSMLGFGTLLIGELPKHSRREWSFVNAVLLLTGGAGLALGFGFSAVAPLVSHDLTPLRDGAVSVTLFAIGVALTSATNVADLALVGMLRGGVQLWRNVVFATSKLAMVAGLGIASSSNSTTGIYLTWTLGNALSLAILAWPIVAGSVPLRALRPDLSLVRGLQRSAAWHHLQNMSLQLSSLVLPLVVIAMLSAADNAYFYIVWLLSAFVFIPPFTLSIGLYTIGARTPQTLPRYLRLSLGVSLLFGMVAAVVTAVAAGPVLQLFGHDYNAHGAAPLRLAVLGVFPLIVKDHFVACCRIQGRIAGASLVLAAGSLVGLAAAAVGAALAGLTGVVLGWLLVEALQTALFLPTVLGLALPRLRAAASAASSS